MNYLEKAEAFREEIRGKVAQAIRRLKNDGTTAIGADNLWQLISLHNCQHGPRGTNAAYTARQEFNSVIEERAFRAFVYTADQICRKCHRLDNRLDDGGLCIHCRQVFESNLAA